MPTYYIGKTSEFVGKTLFEILCNLKNFGVGRMIIRTANRKFPEPSFYIIRKVEPYMDEKLVYGNCWAEEVLRGRKVGDFEDISKQVYKPDYELVPRESEWKYLQGVEKVPKLVVLQRAMAFPPILHEILLRERRAKGEKVTELRLPLVYSQDHKDPRFHRVAEEGEEPEEHFEERAKLSPQFLVGIKEI